MIPSRSFGRVFNSFADETVGRIPKASCLDPSQDQGHYMDWVNLTKASNHVDIQVRNGLWSLIGPETCISGFGRITITRIT